MQWPWSREETLETLEAVSFFAVVGAVIGIAISACTGQGPAAIPTRPLGERVQCQLGVIQGLPVPDEAVYYALSGNPEALTPYLLKRLTPELVVDRLAQWRACETGGSAK